MKQSVGEGDNNRVSTDQNLQIFVGHRGSAEVYALLVT